ncbi:MAG TPA: 16S rRNA (adenine(1518)-N(6)/adenine(1519)-N(6))-dimethyltransferase RsmA [Anaerolineales bacterium]|nr:16S rRNA (adenine(1518)-N(6)/adenine(1519)-N(6))-dimethyltransferase RsmA [Anaerolineales bacterium]
MTGTCLPPLNIPELLRQAGLHPSKSLGQNFLQDERILQSIVASAGIDPSEEILEIGSGLGNLTRYLATAARSVTAVELDKGLFPTLETVLAPYQNIRLVQGDILKLNPADLIESSNYLVVANIPYYITSALLQHLLESGKPPRRMVLTMQKEVAERICARPGKLSLLALSVQVYGNPSILADIPAEAFYPAPKVDSAVLRVEILPEPVIPTAMLDTFFMLIKAGFSQKRKTLRNSLSGGLGIAPAEAEKKLAAARLDPMRRAETLSLEEWKALCAVSFNKKTAK